MLRLFVLQELPFVQLQLLVPVLIVLLSFLAEQVFGGKKLLITYVFGGIMGNLFELIVTFLFPDPFGPSKATISPSLTLNETFQITW